MQPGDGGPVEHPRPSESLLRKFGPQVGLECQLTLHVDRLDVEPRGTSSPSLSVDVLVLRTPILPLPVYPPVDRALYVWLRCYDTPSQGPTIWPRVLAFRLVVRVPRRAIMPGKFRVRPNQMPRHLIGDAHEWINEIPTVPTHYYQGVET